MKDGPPPLKKLIGGSPRSIGIGLIRIIFSKPYPPPYRIDLILTLTQGIHEQTQLADRRGTYNLAVFHFSILDRLITTPVSIGG